MGPSYLPEGDVLDQACSIIKSQYANPELLMTLPSRIGIISSHLQRLFRKLVGCTPRVYLRKVRIAQAAQLLKDGELGHLAINGALVGYAGGLEMKRRLLTIEGIEGVREDDARAIGRVL